MSNFEELANDANSPPAPQPVLPPRTKLMDDIEFNTDHKVTIETEETNDTLRKCHLQEQSILFNNLPREIRDLIWTFATAPYEDQNSRYQENEYYYRPGHTARLKTDFALLLTCRRIWLEANALPMLQAEQCYWFYRPAPDARTVQWMPQLTPHNRRCFGELHVFAQMFAIESLESDAGRLRHMFLQTAPVEGDFQPRMLHVTIRHTDWWNWESEQPLSFEDSWFQAILDTPDLRSTQTIKLELETLNYKVNQLMPIVERLSALQSRQYDSHIVDGRSTPSKFVLHGQQEVREWSGPSNINGHTFSQYKNLEKLNYHIVTLTWRLHFPEHPRAHIPTLRLAPRVATFNQERYFEDTWKGHNETALKWPREYGEPAYEEHHMLDEPQPWRFDMEGRLEDTAMLPRMMDEVIHGAKWQLKKAEDGEIVRRARFLEWMEPHKMVVYEKRWQDENALLGFGPKK